MHKYIVTFIAMLLLSSPVLAKELLCEVRKLSLGEDDLRISEMEFTYEAYQRSVKLLKNMPKKLIDAKNLRRTVDSSETWIGYDTSLRFIQGYVLRTKALNEKSNENISRFCDFMKRYGEYAD